MGEKLDSDGGDSHDARASPDRSAYPSRHDVPWRSDILASLGAIRFIWALPQYTLDLAHLAIPNIGLNESNMLFLLGYRGPLRPMDLASAMGMGRSNISKVINHLLEHGYVERRAESDRRSVRIHLTELGEQASRRLYAAGDMQMAELTRGWSDEEIETFSRLAAIFADNAKELAERLRRGEIPPLGPDIV